MKSKKDSTGKAAEAARKAVPGKKVLQRELKNVLGFTPRETALYEMALSHRSSTGNKDENNERLEYLGDAILGAVIGDFLFRKYPYQPEGYLTEMRSKIVNRQQLNDIAIKMGLRRLTIYNKSNSFLKISGIFGNTLEALIGAVYLDQGFEKTKRFIFKRIVLPYIDLEALENVEINHKNKLYGWASKYSHQLDFELLDEHLEGSRRLFTVAVVIDGEVICSAKGYNKKDASQLAASTALESLGITQEKPQGDQELM